MKGRRPRVRKTARSKTKHRGNKRAPTRVKDSAKPDEAQGKQMPSPRAHRPRDNTRRPETHRAARAPRRDVLHHLLHHELVRLRALDKFEGLRARRGMGVIMHVWRGEMQSGRAVEGTPVRHVLFRHGHAMAATRYERAATTYLSNHFVGGVAT